MFILTLIQDVAKIVEGIEKLSERVGLDPKLLKYVWWAAIALLLLRLLTWLKNLVWEEYVKPLRTTPEEKRRLARRQQFASFVEGRIRDINSKEEWRDHRFTELEAEVEAEGERQAFTLVPFLQRTRSGLRKEKSLSRAIERSRERLIQLEGEPGSGKSVALRFLARQMAERTARSRNLKRPIPLYLNLKELSRKPDEAVDRNLIESFVKSSLTRAIDRDIEKFLEEEFARGMEEGTWLFLFDSFDEIPEVLSSTEADAMIRGYAEAISDFLGGMNRCRGVVASRHFRSPGQSRWPRFRILPLSEERRLRLIKQALLPVGIEQEVKAQLVAASPEARNMFSNPMLLGLLCEHMKGGNPFPENVHTVLASYLDHRLNRDSDRVARRYAVAPADVRAAAEAAAFSMAADAGLGLSPSREHLKLAIRHQGLEVAEHLDTLLDALVFIKLARSEDAADGSKDFTFAHRRFQEYFATCVVLREPERVPPRALLTDARWRETAVVMFQSQPAPTLSTLVAEARGLLDEMVAVLPPAPDDDENDGGDENGDADDERPVTQKARPERFAWLSGSLHVLSLLQDGFRRRRGDLPEELRGMVGRVLLAANLRTGLYDRKCALEVAGAATEKELLGLLRNAFKSKSQLLKNIAYQQVAALGKIPDDVAKAIYGAVFNLFVGGRLHRERLATRTHLARLERPQRFISALNLLLALPNIDLLLHVAGAALLCFALWRGLTFRDGFFDLPRSVLMPFSLSLLTVSHLFLRMPQLLAGRWLMVWSSFMMRALFLVVVGLNLPPRSPLLLAFFYMLVWAPSAMSAARSGSFTGWRWWPLMPVVPLLNSLTTLSWAGFRDIFNVPLKYFLLVPLVIVGGGLFVALMLIPFTLAMFFSSFSLVVSYFIDWARWRKRRSAYGAPMTGAEFVNECARFRTGSHLSRFVRLIRMRGQLSADPATDELLLNLSLAIEGRLDEVQQKKGGMISEAVAELFSEFRPVSLLRAEMPLADAEEFDDWYPQAFKSSRISFDEERAVILDELTLLLEQVRSNMRDRVGASVPPAVAETAGAVSRALS